MEYLKPLQVIWDYLRLGEKPEKADCIVGFGNFNVNIGQANCNFPDGTNPAKLTDSTIGANQRFFEKRKGAPTCAYTMGISSILQLHSC